MTDITPSAEAQAKIDAYADHLIEYHTTPYHAPTARHDGVFNRLTQSRANLCEYIATLEAALAAETRRLDAVRVLLTTDYTAVYDLKNDIATAIDAAQAQGETT